MHGLEPIPVSDFTKAMEFWQPLLETVGYAPQHNFTGIQTFGKTAHCPNFSIVQGDKERFTTRNIRLQVVDSEEVEALLRKAVALGGTEIEWPDMMEGDKFMGKFLDCDGNTVVVYCQEQADMEFEEF
jgi:predicted enzyme related to lactoylglutathione lyase